LIGVVRQNEIVSSYEVKRRANLSRPVVVAAQWVNQHEIMLGFEAVQESSLPDPWNQLDLSVGSARYLTAPFITVVQPAHLQYRDDLALPHDPPWLWRILA
jgi:hypothetical protein